jgi:hypothetical protein
MEMTGRFPTGQLFRIRLWDLDARIPDKFEEMFAVGGHSERFPDGDLNEAAGAADAPRA